MKKILLSASLIGLVSYGASAQSRTTEQPATAQPTATEQAAQPATAQPQANTPASATDATVKEQQATQLSNDGKADTNGKQPDPATTPASTEPKKEN